MSAFVPEQDVANQLVAAGAVWGPAGGLYAFVQGNNGNLFMGQPKSPYETGVSGVNPGVFVDPSIDCPEKAQPFINASQSGSIFPAAIRLWVIAPGDQPGVDGKALGYQLARQLRDYFHMKVGIGLPILPGYISATTLDRGEPRIKKTNEARQLQFYTDFLLRWTNVN